MISTYSINHQLVSPTMQSYQSITFSGDGIGGLIDLKQARKLVGVISTIKLEPNSPFISAIPDIYIELPFYNLTPARQQLNLTSSPAGLYQHDVLYIPPNESVFFQPMDLLTFNINVQFRIHSPIAGLYNGHLNTAINLMFYDE